MRNQSAVPLVELHEPRAQTLDSEVWAPFLQATITGIVVGGAITAVMHYVEPDSDTLSILGLSVMCCIAVAWIVFLRIALRTIWRREVRQGQDLDGDGIVGRPPALMAVNPDVAVKESEKRKKETKQGQRVEDLIAFVRKCATVGTSESAQGIKPNERKAYLDNRDMLFRLGLAKWTSEKNRKSGWELTLTPAEAVVLIKRHVQEL